MKERRLELEPRARGDVRLEEKEELTSSAGSGATGNLSNGGSGGSTGSSAGKMTSNPWCSGAE